MPVKPAGNQRAIFHLCYLLFIEGPLIVTGI